MGYSESEQLACKKHQNHNQLQGVCPFCLTERLSHLLSCARKQQTLAIMAAAAAPRSFSSSLLSSSSAFSAIGSSPHPDPPAATRPLHHRNVSEVMGSIALMFTGGGSGLKKSRSIAFGNPGGELKTGKKKTGFWSRLLHLEKKK